MKTSTPHDVPVHMLDNPERYITKAGSRLPELRSNPHFEYFYGL